MLCNTVIHSVSIHQPANSTAHPPPQSSQPGGNTDHGEPQQQSISSLHLNPPKVQPRVLQVLFFRPHNASCPDGLSLSPNNMPALPIQNALDYFSHSSAPALSKQNEFAHSYIPLNRYSLWACNCTNAASIHEYNVAMTVIMRADHSAHKPCMSPRFCSHSDSTYSFGLGR